MGICRVELTEKGERTEVELTVISEYNGQKNESRMEAQNVPTAKNEFPDIINAELTKIQNGLKIVV